MKPTSSNPLLWPPTCIHLADEVGGHVRRDKPNCSSGFGPIDPACWRNTNARILSAILHEYFNVPKRGGWRVVQELLREFSGGDATLLPKIRRELHAPLRLNEDRLSRHTLHTREIFKSAPYLRPLFSNQWPEFRFLEQVLPWMPLTA